MSAILVFSNMVTAAVVLFGITALVISMAVCCLLLIGFREVADRAIAFDLAMVHVVGLIALSAIVLEQTLLLDTLIVVAVLGFLGTVAIARYLERGLRPPQQGATSAPHNGTRPETR